MKHFALLCVLLILVNFSMQIPKYENCPTDVIESHTIRCECCKLTCSADGKEISGTSCGVSRCTPGSQIGYHDGDNTKEFPECCSHPICE